MTTVGEGDYTYELVPSWPNVPKYWTLGMASDGAVNSKDEVHIFSRGLHPLTIWTTDGDFISSWGEGQFSANPHGIYIAPNDNVWLVDRDFHIATEYTPSGDELRTFGEKLAPSPSFVGEPFKHALGPGDSARRQYLRVRRLRRSPRTQVQPRGRPAPLLGTAGHRPRGVRPAPQPLGRQPQPRAHMRPGEPPHPAIRRRRATTSTSGWTWWRRATSGSRTTWCTWSSRARAAE